MKKLSLALMLLLMGLLAGCNFRDAKVSPSTGGGGPEPQKLTPNFSSLKAMVFVPKCATCHAGAAAKAGMDITNYSDMMNSGNVVAGAPDDSMVYTDVRDHDMPDGGPYLSDTEVQMIKTWIQNGAKND